MQGDTLDVKTPDILVVEDEAAHAEAIRRQIVASGMTSDIRIVTTLHDYRAAVVEKTPDIVLMDYKLPDGSALDVLVSPAENGRFPVLLMTSFGTEEIAVQALKSGAIDYVVKSPDSFRFMPQKVASVLREWAHIGERKRYQQELQEAKEDWERTFDSVPDPITLVNSDFSIRRINRAMAACLAENNIGDPTGAKCYSIFHDSDRPVAGCPHQRLLASGTEEHQEIVCFGRVYDVSVTPLRDISGGITGAVHLWHDVSERKETEATRMELERKLQQAQKMEAVGQLAGGVAHDFNNIMQVIAGNTQLLKIGGAVSQGGLENLHEIEVAIERGASLTKGLLTFSRYRVKEFTPIDLNQLVEETFPLAKKLVTEEIDFLLESAGPLPVLGERALLQQMIFNLVTNSRDAISGHGTIILRTGVRTFTHKALLTTDGLGIEGDAYAFMAISDSGSGMTMETREKAFEPFFTTKDIGKGTGLGLAMAYGTASQHSGFIQIESDPGKGCTITMYIPILSQHPAADSPPNEEIFHGKGETVLLAEDEESVRQMIQVILEKAGYKVLPTRDGNEAVELFRRYGSQIDLVVLDAVMPKQNGFAAIEAITAHRPDTPFLILSGYSLDLHQSHTIPRDRLLSKPVHPLKLLKSIRYLLAQTNTGNGD